MDYRVPAFPSEPPLRRVLAAACAAMIGFIVIPPAAAQTTVGGDGSDSTYSTNVTSGSLTKIGTNTVTLTGSNTYAGGTFINAGTLQFAAAGNIGTSDVTLNGGTAAYTGVTGTITRQMPVTANSGFAVTSGSTLTWLGNLNGNGRLTLTGPGTLVLGGNYDNTVNGIRVESGTLRAAHGANYFLLGYGRGTGGNIDSSLLEIGAAGTVQVEGTDNFQGGVTRYTTTTYANTPVQIEGGLMTFVDPGAGTQNNTIGKFTFINGGTLDIQTRNRVDLNSLGGIVSSGTGATTISGGGTLNVVKRASGDTPTIDVAAAAPLTISAVLDSTSVGNSTGGLGITKTGSGTLTLTAANSYGATTITAGVIQVGNGGTSGSLGTGSVTNNASLIFNRGGSLTVGSAISGSGSVTNTGTGTVTLSGNNSFSGGTTITSGAVQVGSSTAFGTGGVVNNSQISVNSGSDFTVANAISGTGLISKAGVGTLTLSGTSSFSGGVTIAAGGIAVPHGSSLGSGTVRFTAPSTFTVTGTAVTLGNPFDLGSVSGTVSLVVPSPSSTVINGPITGGIAGTMLLFNNATSANGGVLTLNGTNSFQGTLFVNRGPVVLGNASAAGASSITLFANNNPLGDLQFGAGGFTIPNNVQLSNAGVGNWIGVPAGQTNGISGVISGNGFTKIGDGTLVLAADNSYSGGTTFTSGTVQVGNGGAAGSLGSGNVANGGGLVFNRAGSVTVGGIISGTGSLTQAGPGATLLTGGNTYTGATTISSGTLQVGSGGSGSTLGGSGSITNNGSLVFNIGDAQTLSRPVTGSGGLAMVGSGTLTLSGTNAYSAGTTIGGGVLAVSGSANIGAAPITFTAPATLNVTATSAATFGNTLSIAPSGESTLLKQSPGTLDYAGSIGGGGTGATLFFQTSAGDTSTTFTLSGSNSFRGTMNLNRGNLIVANVNALGDPANLLYVNQYVDTSAGNIRFTVSGTFANPVQLQLSPSSIETGTTDVVLTGSISGNGLYKLGGGRLTLAGTAANSYTTTTIASGTLQVGTGGVGGSLGTGDVTNNGVLVFNRSGSFDQTGSIGGTGAVVLDGSGTLNLKTPITAPGGIHIRNGSLRLAGDGSTDYFVAGTEVTVAGGTLDYGGYSESSGAGLTLQSGTITNGTAISTAYVLEAGRVAAALAGSGSVSKNTSGIVVLAGNNTYSGSTTISAGTLAVGDGGTGGALGSGAVVNDATLVFNRSNALTVASAISGSGVLIQRGVGTTTLTGQSTHTGGTLVEAGTLLLSGSNRLAPASTATVNAGGTLRLDGDQTLASIAGSGAITFGTSATGYSLTTGSVSGTFAGSISGFGYLKKEGPGTLTLTGSNTYMATTLVSGGTLATGGVNVLPTNGNVTVNAGGTLLLGGNQDTRSASGSGIYDLNGFTLRLVGGAASFSGDATGGGTLQKDGFGIWSVYGTTSGSTSVVLNGGSIKLMAANRLSDSGAVTVNNGVFDMNGFTDVAGSMTINGGKIINGTLQAVAVNMDNGSVTGVLTGTGGFTKTSAGTVTISSTSTYTGETAIQAGTLATTGANRLAAAGSVNVSAGGTFKMGGDQTLASVAGAGSIDLGNGSLTTGSTSSTFAGSITGNGGLTKAGPGTLTLSGSSSFTGDTNLTAGTLVLASANALPTDAVVTMSAGATLQVSGTTVVGAIEQNGGTITGGSLMASLVSTQSGALDSAIQNLVVNGTTYAAGILKRGAGTTTVGAANSFTGSIKVQGGTLQLTGSGGFDPASSLVMSSSATLDLNGKSQTFANLTGAGGTVALGSGELTVENAAAGLFAGTISGSGGLVKGGAGRLELTGNNTYTGATAVQAGEFKLNGSVASSLVSLAAGATLSGTGSIGGDATIEGIHAPGNSPGIQTVVGNLAYTAGSSVAWELAGNTAALADRGVEFDGINVGGSLTFSGATALTLAFNASGSLVNWNDAFWATDKLGTDGWLIYDVAGTTTGLSNLSISGTTWLDGAGNSLLAIRPDASFALEQVGNDVYLTFVAVPEPSSLILAGLGAAIVVWAARRRQ